MPTNANRRVLILCAEPLLGALVASVVEAADATPHFAREGESATEALERVRPMAVVLLDAMHQDAGSEIFLGRARRYAAELLLFGSAGALRDAETWARAQGIPTFALPEQFHELKLAVDRACSTSRV